MLEQSPKKNTIIKKYWIQPFLDYFKNIKNYNDKIEIIRQKLCLVEHFNPYELFNYLDFRNNGFLTSKNIIYFLNQINTKFEEQYVRCLIHNYDKDGDFTLNINEFLNIILPVKNKNIKDKILSLNNNLKDIKINNISNEIKYNFNELIKEELQLAESSFYATKNIYGSPKFTTYEAFIDIVKNESYITRKNLNMFLRENELVLEDEDLYMLMFRIDSDNDNRISYVEFQDIFYPLKQLEKYKDNSYDKYKDLNNEILENQFLNENNLYSKHYNYDYKGYNSLKNNNFLFNNNNLKNNYYVKDNNNPQIYNQNYSFDISEYQNFINKVNSNLINIPDNNTNKYKIDFINH